MEARGGGVIKSNELPKNATLRLAQQETGLTLSCVKVLMEKSYEERKFYIYGTYLESFEGLRFNRKNTYKDELLEVDLFSVTEIVRGKVPMMNFHREIVRDVVNTFCYNTP